MTTINASLEDPFTAEVLELSGNFSNYLLFFVSTDAKFPEVIYEFYAAAAMAKTPEESFEKYEAVRRTSLDGLLEIRDHPILGTKSYEFAILEAKVHASLEKLERHYNALDWRKCFVQRHFVVAIGAMQMNHLSLGTNKFPSISEFFNELAALRNSVFENSRASNIAAYLENSSFIRQQSIYRLRYEALQNSPFSNYPPLDEIVAMEDELSIRVLFEEATH